MFAINPFLYSFFHASSLFLNVFRVPRKQLIVRHLSSPTKRNHLNCRKRCRTHLLQESLPQGSDRTGSVQTREKSCKVNYQSPRKFPHSFFHGAPPTEQAPKTQQNPQVAILQLQPIPPKIWGRERISAFLKKDFLSRPLQFCLKCKKFSNLDLWRELRVLGVTHSNQVTLKYSFKV